MTDVAVLEVLLHGRPIATLTHVGGDRTLFAFNDDYVADTERPVLSLHFKDRFGELTTGFKPTQSRLLPFFSNLLPEGPLRDYLADRAGVSPAREFLLLRVLGLDLPGGITVRPLGVGSWPPEDRGDGIGADRDPGNRQQTAMRFSLAGVQVKFSAVNEARGGLTIPARGVGGSWIVKLPSREFAGVPENEFSMMTLARLVGINVPPVQLVDVAAIANLPEGIGVLNGRALAVRRFDRTPDGDTVHIEDFAQVFGVYPEEKYRRASARNIAEVILAEGGDADIVEFIRRLTFNTLIGNADMHLKNWSLIYPDRRRAALAPAYDFVSTIAYLPDASAALKISRTKRFDAFSEDELVHLASKARLSSRVVLDTAREIVARFHEHWRTEQANLPLPRDTIAAIDAHVKKVPIAAVTNAASAA